MKAGRYVVWLIHGLFSYPVLQPLARYFRNQRMIRPLLITSKFVLCLHVPLCRLLVYKSGIGFLGGALAKGLSSWLCASPNIYDNLFNTTCHHGCIKITLCVQ
ncbi:hypothetical protein Bca52824_057542 [Brassica carinata]|uniref:Uncharacterized protein n=1 Tax=Brassica carinata TaxID=52824 RepID=A0A8X7QRG7_BRACI|nr:hypothetical protein Bca52824_057542 [Brassica carinata]